MIYQNKLTARQSAANRHGLVKYLHRGYQELRMITSGIKYLQLGTRIEEVETQCTKIFCHT